MEKDKVRLSQCMIVKNEEKNMEKALSWGKGIVCEQIVVDTGSSDHTVKLAEKMGATVLHFTWNDDFSAAKNYAIRQAKGNWIAFLDADEWFAKEDADKLLPLLKGIHAHKDIDFVRTRMVHIKEDGGIIGSTCQDRIFRNKPELRYQYRIHESLRHEGKPVLQGKDVQEQLTILHSGYSLQNTGPEKGERNARLLRQDLKEHPKDGMRWAYLGDACIVSGKPQEALECYRRVLEDPHMEMTHLTTQVHCGLQIMGLRADEPAEQTGEEFHRIQRQLTALGWETHPDLDFYMGCWHLKAGQITESADLFEKAIEKLETYHGEELVRFTANMELVNRVLATAALMERKLQKSVQFSVAAIKLNKYGADSIQLLLRAFLTEYQEGRPVEPYWQFLCKLYDTQNLKDLLFLHKFSGEAGFEALQAHIWEDLPEFVQKQLER